MRHDEHYALEIKLVKCFWLMFFLISFPPAAEALRPQTVLDPVNRILINCRSVYCPDVVPKIQKYSPAVKIDLFVEDPTAVEQVYPFKLTHVSPRSDAGAPFFLRDVGLFFLDGSSPTFVELPYANLSLGDTVSAFFRWSKMPGISSYLNAFLTQQQAKAINEIFDPRERFAAYYNATVEFHLDRRSISPSMGGDYLALPDGPLLVGETGWSHFPDELEKFFKSYTSVVRIRLPDSLSVGHLDEVFTTLPYPRHGSGECAFALIFQTEDEFLKYDSEHPDSYLYWGKDTGPLTSDSTLIRAQAQAIQRIMKPKCRLRAVEISGMPLRRTRAGLPLANGVSVGDIYYFSLPENGTRSERYANFFDEKIEGFKSTLAKLGIQAVGLRTDPALSSGGGFHCATQEIRK